MKRQREIIQMEVLYVMDSEMALFFFSPKRKSEQDLTTSVSLCVAALSKCSKSNNWHCLKPEECSHKFPSFPGIRRTGKSGGRYTVSVHKKCDKYIPKTEQT